MMLKGIEPGCENRHYMFEMLTEKEVSMSTRAMLTEPMSGLPDEEKEKVAKVLLKIIERSKTEEEMLETAVRTFGTKVMTRYMSKR